MPSRVCKIDLREFARGVKEEHEHTTKLHVAMKIALDHLAEDPMYYTKLARAFGKKSKSADVKCKCA